MATIQIFRPGTRPVTYVVPISDSALLDIVKCLAHNAIYCGES